MKEFIYIGALAIVTGLALGGVGIGASLGVSPGNHIRVESDQTNLPPVKTKSVWFLTVSKPVGPATVRRFVAHYPDMASCESVRQRSDFESGVTTACVELQVRDE